MTKENEIRYVALSQLEANDYNPNEINETDLAKLRKHIQLNGVLQPIIVRLGETQDLFIIVDGEHRWKLAQELGLTEVPVIVKDMSREEAMIETISMNKFRGENNSVKLGKVIKELREHFSDDVLTERLGYTGDELSSLVEITEFDFDDIHEDDALKDFEPPKDDALKLSNDFILTVTLTQLDIIETALKCVIEEAQPENFCKADALTLLCRDYLIVNHQDKLEEVQKRAGELQEIDENKAS